VTTGSRRAFEGGRRTRWMGRAALVAVLLVWGTCTAKSLWNAPGYDLSALVVGAKVLHDGGVAHLYDHNDRYYNIADSPEFERAARELGFSGYAPTAFVHPPLLAAVCAPLTELAFPTAVRIWLIVSLLATAAGIALAIRVYAPRWATAGWLAVAFAAMACFEPVRYSLWLGQTTPFVFLDVIGAAWLLRRKRDLAAGLVLSLSVFLKLTPIVFAVSWAWRRRFRALSGVGAGLLVLVLVSVAVTGIGPNLVYVRRVAQIAGITLITFNNHSVPAFLTRWTFRQPDLGTFLMIAPPSWVRWTMLGVTVLVTALVLVLTRQRRDGALLDAFCALAMLLLPSIAWTHYFVFLVPVALVIATRLPRGLPLRLGGPACVCLLALCARPFIPDQTDFEPTRGATLAGPTYAALGMLVLLVTVAVLRSRGSQRPGEPRAIVDVVS
jgi:alpha-1,2-mannosyltransferase